MDEEGDAMREEKRKETLTRADIRRDLRRELRKAILLAVVLTECLISLPLLCIASLREGIWPEFDHPIYTWGMYVLTVIAVPVAILYLCRVIQAFRTNLFVTTGHLIAADYEEGRYKGCSYTWCYLTFSGYDRYAVRTIPGKTHHPWSQLYPLSAEGEYYYASTGDEYYLVLSKPHSGKILMVYNKKLFELVD